MNKLSYIVELYIIVNSLAMNDQKESRSNECKLQIPPEWQIECTTRHDQHSDGITDGEDDTHPGTVLLRDILSHWKRGEWG